MSSVLCQIRGARESLGRSWKAWANLLALVGTASRAQDSPWSWAAARWGRSRRRHQGRRAETEGRQAGSETESQGLPFPAWERPPQTPPRPPPLQAAPGPIEAPGARRPNPGAGPRLSTLRRQSPTWLLALDRLPLGSKFR